MAFVFWSCGASFLHPLLQLKSHAYGFHGLCGFCGLCSTSYVLRNVLDVCSCGIVELEQFMALTSVAFLASLVFPFFWFLLRVCGSHVCSAFFLCLPKNFEGLEMFFGFSSFCDFSGFSYCSLLAWFGTWLFLRAFCVSDG